MPIISRIGRRSWKTRLLNISIHVILICGAITMIYPMLLMVSGSFKSNVDKNEMEPIPTYFTNSDVLFSKLVESKYNEKIDVARMAHRKNYLSFEDVFQPEEISEQAVEDWREYLESSPPEITEYDLGFIYALGIVPRNARNFKASLQEKFDGDLKKMNEELGTFYSTWWEIGSLPENLHMKATRLVFPPFQQEFHKFKDKSALRDRYTHSLSGFFVEETLKPKYTTRIEKLNSELGTSYVDYRQINLTPDLPDGPLKDHWAHFVRKNVNLQYVKVRDAETEKYRTFLAERYPSIDSLNKVYKTDYQTFDEIDLPAELPVHGAAYSDWEYFIANEVAEENLYLEAPEFDFREFIERKYGAVGALNEAYELGFEDFSEVELTESQADDNVVAADDWLEFVRAHVPVADLFLDNAAAADYMNLLKERYGTDSEGSLDLENLNAAYGTSYSSVLDVEMPKPPYKITGKALSDWKEFIREIVNPVYYTIDPEQFASRWETFLREEYGTVAALNEEWGEIHTIFLTVSPPYLMTDFREMLENKKPIFWEFLTRNYKMVFEYLVFHGRGLFNTVVYCGLSVAALLIVNPIAAYALSRYKLPSTYKVLLFFMLTMTFPPIVLGIPNFLLLKNLGLLNTFAALILPAMANGYAIFLLKGFFDSLPQELFEAAKIDGASEYTMFWQITMALSKPILAVIALQGFTRAYSNFMFAFIVCQDERMWTLMVWLYQLQQMASQPVVFASLIVAAIPTLLLFVFCQNIIMRGIVVPVEK